MLVKCFLLLWLVAAGTSQERHGDLESLLEDVYGTTNPAPASTVPAKDKAYTPCTKRDGNVGECVPYYLCSDKVEDPGLIDIHISIESACESYLDVCCSVSGKKETLAQIETKANGAKK